MPSILIPQDVADKCYLKEALFWVAFNRYPEEYFDLDREPIRTSYQHVGGLTADIPEFGDFVKPEESKRVGLPIDPFYLQMMEDFDVLLEYGKACSSWQEKLCDFLDIYQSKLFMSLKQGEISAYGRKLNYSSFDKAHVCLDNKKFDILELKEELIPADLWNSSGINWDNHYLETKDSVFVLIMLRTEALVSCFPPEVEQDAKNVIFSSGQYILTDNIKPLNKGKGRPSYPWADFYAEVVSRALSKQIPKKQEAFILDMQDWCKTNWGVEVGRSTILQNISKIHKVIHDKKVRN